jgi:hypothetical protein
MAFETKKTLLLLLLFVSNCGLITILTIKKQNRQSIMSFIIIQKIGFQVQKCIYSSNNT